MLFILFLMAWLIAPIIELGIIIALLVQNGEYKKKIQELTKKASSAVGVETARPVGMQPVQPERVPIPPIPPAANQSLQQSHSGENQMGTAAMVIGVVFVVLAGLVFATTSWRILPSIIKVLLVLALSGIFFVASILAEKKFCIYKTSNTFFVLSSIFLFLSVLAAAYFRLLGPVFILEGTNRWWVLWAGSLITLCMLFLGIKRFHDQIYTQACFWGLTVSMTFLMLAFQADWWQFVSSMAIYAFLLISGQWGTWKYLKGIKNLHAPGCGRTTTHGSLAGALDIPEFMPPNRRRTFKVQTEEDPGKECSGFALLADGFHKFAPIHFWIFGVLMIACGILRGSIFYILGYVPEWYMVLALATVTAGIVLKAAWRQEKWMKVLFGLSVAVLLRCAMARGYVELFGGEQSGEKLMAYVSDNIGILGAILLAQSLTALWMIWGKMKKMWLRTAKGDCIYIAFMVADMLFLQLHAVMEGRIGMESAVWYRLAGLMGTLILTAVILFVCKNRPGVRRLLPIWFFYVLFSVHGCLECERQLFDGQLWTGLYAWIDKGLLEFLLMGILMVWDRRKRYGFYLPLLFLGIVAQLVYFSETEITCPFFLLLSVYLMGEKSPFRYRTAAVCSMIGFFALVCPFTSHNSVLRGLTVIGVYWIWYLVDVKFKLDEKMMSGTNAGIYGSDFVFWDTCGCILMAYTMAVFYFDRELEIWNLLLCLAIFAVFYIKFYLGNQMWPHLIISLMLLLVPEILNVRYNWTTSLLYTVVGAGFFLTGIISRLRRPIAEEDREVLGGWRVDWYHVLAILVLAPMAMTDYEGKWKFVYLLLISLYFMQYGAVKPWKQLAWSAAAFSLAAAVWNQPFITWPKVLHLEIQLIPAVAYIWGLGYIWRGTDGSGKENKEGEAASKEQRLKVIRDLQTVGYVLCLITLSIDAWDSKDVINALILEGICLSVFLWAQIAKCRRWVRISGTIIVVIALYMTKGFWLSISWWVYLLAAGIGLIVFAAVNEKKKR